MKLLTRIAFLLAISLVLARCTILETIRDPFAVNVGSSEVPRGAGVSAGLVLDSLCWLPLILVLVRRLVDKSYSLNFSPAMMLAVGLSVWAMVSVGWSADKFSAAVMAFHFLSAVILFIAVAQIVRTWAHFRMAGAMVFGLLLVFATHGLYYRLVDLPDLQRSFEKNKTEILHERGWEPGTFAAEQFSRKIEGGEMIGFSASPNTFAAMIVLCSIITAGIALQRLTDRDHPGFLAAYAVGIAAGGYVTFYTHSKAAAVAMGLGFAALAALYLLPQLMRWLAAYRRSAFFGMLGLIVLGAGAVVGHGVYHHSLPTDSLNFRWRYWVGSMALLRSHPWLGVGFNNFGNAYLSTRLQVAAEEIKDPHNVLLRFFLELGIVGGVLAAGFFVRAIWEMTRPVELKDDAEPDHRFITGRLTLASPVVRVGLIALLATLIATLASEDFDQGLAFSVVELFKRGLFLCVLFAGGMLVAIRQLEQADSDGRHAVWIARAVVVGILLLLLQSLIDVTFFEIGPLFFFFFLVGVVVGIRSPVRMAWKGWPVVVLGVVVISAAAGQVLLVVPTLRAEGMAVEGDATMRATRPDMAARWYEGAFAVVPWNADYAFRAGKAALAAGDAAGASRLLDLAITADPGSPEYHLVRAGAEMSKPQPDDRVVRREYETATNLNPNDLQVQLTYAGLLAGRLKDPAAARERYEMILKKNEEYDLTEPRRLGGEELKRIREKLAG